MEAPARQEQASPEVRQRVQASFGRQGLMSHLGARITRIGPGRVHIVLPGRPEVTQQHGYFHAGATSAIADSAGGYAALTLFPEDADVLTVEYKINLLAPGVGDHIEAVGTVLKAGRTLTVCRLEVYGVQGEIEGEGAAEHKGKSTDKDKGADKGAGERKLVANGQQTLIRVNRPEQ